MPTVETDLYKIETSEYIKMLYLRFVSDKWWMLLAAVVPCVALSFLNLNFIYVALIVAFIVLPMLFAFVYIVYGFADESISAIRYGKVVIGKEGVRKIFYDAEGDTEIGCREYHSSVFSDYAVTEKFVVLRFKKMKYSCLLIPLNAFPTKRSREEAIEMISKW